MWGLFARTFSYCSGCLADVEGAKKKKGFIGLSVSHSGAHQKFLLHQCYPRSRKRRRTPYCHGKPELEFNINECTCGERCFKLAVCVPLYPTILIGCENIVSTKFILPGQRQKLSSCHFLNHLWLIDSTSSLAFFNGIIPKLYVFPWYIFTMKNTMLAVSILANVCSFVIPVLGAGCNRLISMGVCCPGSGPIQQFWALLAPVIKPATIWLQDSILNQPVNLLLILTNVSISDV